MEYALCVLGYRPRSEDELRRRLERKGYPPHVTDRTLATLMRLGLLDDRDFANGWVTFHADRGPARLRQELRAKGIDRALAEEVISARMTREDELTAALEVARRAVRTRTPPLDRDELLRVRRLLQRRGFSYEVVGRVCTRLNDQLTDEGEWLE